MSIGRWAQIFTLLSGRQPGACGKHCCLVAERLSVQLVGPIEENPMTNLNVLAAVSALSTHGV
jgi:hypothetical protein